MNEKSVQRITKFNIPTHAIEAINKLCQLEMLSFSDILRRATSLYILQHRPVHGSNLTATGRPALTRFDEAIYLANHTYDELRSLSGCQIENDISKIPSPSTADPYPSPAEPCPSHTDRPSSDQPAPSQCPPNNWLSSTDTQTIRITSSAEFENLATTTHAAIDNTLLRLTGDHTILYFIQHKRKWRQHLMYVALTKYLKQSPFYTACKISL